MDEQPIIQKNRNLPLPQNYDALRKEGLKVY